MNAPLSTEATASIHRWLHLWNTPDLATRTTIEWSPRLTRSLGRCYPERRLIRLAAFLDIACGTSSKTSSRRKAAARLASHEGQMFL